MANSIAILSVIPRLSYHIRTRLPNVTIFDVLPGENDTMEKLRNVEILITDSNLFLPYTNKLPSLKWIQTTWAGVESVISAMQDKNVEYTVTRFSDHSFGCAMSEYVIAQVCNFERDQRGQYRNQENKKWVKDGRISNHRFICDLSIGILGVGNIGKSIAQRLKTFGAIVWGITKTPLKESLDYLDEHGTMERLPEMLSSCDYVINVLPSTPDTIGLLNGTVLKHCQKRGTVFINIGRGTIIRETDLINALEQQWISGAILDVFEQEPLREESKLWSFPQVTISPHVAGITRAQDVANFFMENYQRFLNNERLLNVINLKTGY